MITINNLKKQYGETVACDIPQLTIADGDIIGLVGNNGAGKTTLFRLLLDLVKADEGTVNYCPLFTSSTIPEGEAPVDAPVETQERSTSNDAQHLTINPAESEEWKHFTAAYIDEGFLIDFLTPDEYFSFLGRICSINDVEERLAAYQQLAGDEIIGGKKLIRNLSAGNKQKVGIIGALIQRPQVLILDEPFNFLDPSGQNMLKHVLTDYHSLTGATIIISSHNLQHTTDISTRILLMEHGQIIADGADRQQLEEYFA